MADEDNAYIAKHCLQTYLNYIQKTIIQTTIKRGRNHGGISILVSPFPEIFFQRWFVTSAPLQWKVTSKGERESTVTHVLKS